MKKMQMNIENDITFLQGCDEYILDCMARKLRNGTLRHYNDSTKQTSNRLKPITITSCVYF